MIFSEIKSITYETNKIVRLTNALNLNTYVLQN